MLNNKKVFIYNLCFGLSKLYTNIQQDQKAKLDYHMAMLFAYMAGWEGLGQRFENVSSEGFRFFSTCFVCGWVCGWGRGVRFSTSPSVEKITDPLLFINDWPLYQKVPRVTTSLIFFKILLVLFLSLIFNFRALSLINRLTLEA